MIMNEKIIKNFIFFVSMNNLSDSYNEEFIEINTPKGLVYMNYDKILESENAADKTIDLFLVKDIQSTYPCYVVTPTIMWQAPGFSDIQQRHLNYTGFMKNIS